MSRNCFEPPRLQERCVWLLLAASYSSVQCVRSVQDTTCRARHLRIILLMDQHCRDLQQSTALRRDKVGVSRGSRSEMPTPGFELEIQLKQATNSKNRSVKFHWGLEVLRKGYSASAAISRSGTYYATRRGRDAKVESAARHAGASAANRWINSPTSSCNPISTSSPSP